MLYKSVEQIVSYSITPLPLIPETLFFSKYATNKCLYSLSTSVANVIDHHGNLYFGAIFECISQKFHFVSSYHHVLHQQHMHISKAPQQLVTWHVLQFVVLCPMFAQLAMNKCTLKCHSRFVFCCVHCLIIFFFDST